VLWVRGEGTCVDAVPSRYVCVVGEEVKAPVWMLYQADTIVLWVKEVKALLTLHQSCT